MLLTSFSFKICFGCFHYYNIVMYFANCLLPHNSTPGDWYWLICYFIKLCNNASSFCYLVMDELETMQTFLRSISKYWEIYFQTSF